MGASMFGRGWEPGEATIVARKEIKSIGRHGVDVSAAKLKSYEFVADVRPASGGAVFRTVLHEPFDERVWRRPSVGDLVAVKCDAGRQKAKFDTGPATSAVKAQEAQSAGTPGSVSRMKEILAQAKVEMAAGQVAAHGARDEPTAGDDRLERLERLAGLRDHGVLSDEEFVTEKARILGS
jgi:hypothetical protein